VTKTFIEEPPPELELALVLVLVELLAEVLPEEVEPLDAVLPDAELVAPEADPPPEAAPSSPQPEPTHESTIVTTRLRTFIVPPRLDRGERSYAVVAGAGRKPYRAALSTQV
jgi:hypothetical protein